MGYSIFAYGSQTGFAATDPLHDTYCDALASVPFTDGIYAIVKDGCLPSTFVFVEEGRVAQYTPVDATLHLLAVLTGGPDAAPSWERPAPPPEPEPPTDAPDEVFVGDGEPDTEADAPPPEDTVFVKPAEDERGDDDPPRRSRRKR
jgi:hypothetical protein